MAQVNEIVNCLGGSAKGLMKALEQGIATLKLRDHWKFVDTGAIVPRHKSDIERWRGMVIRALNRI